MKCPLCSKEAPDAAAECPSCGAIFAKLRARRERELAQAAAALAQLENPAPAADTSLRARQVRWALAAVAIAAWMLGLGLFYRARMGGTASAPKPKIIAPDGATLRVRDRATGKEVPVEVFHSRRNPAPRQPNTSRLGDAPPGTPAYDPDFDE